MTTQATQTYQAKYNQFSDHIGFLVKAISEESADTIYSVSRSAGEDGVKALLHVLLDNGHREVLIHALNSPAITGWVREMVEVLLYGEGRQTAWLFKPTQVH